MQQSFSQSVADFFWGGWGGGCFHPATTQRITKCWSLSSPVSPMRAAKTRLPLRRWRRVMKPHLKLCLIIVAVSSAASLCRRDLIKCKALAGDCVVRFFHRSFVTSHLGRVQRRDRDASCCKTLMKSFSVVFFIVLNMNL